MKTIVFIVGLGHSGSTVFGMALGSFKKAFHMGEIQELPLEIKKNTNCVCGELVQNCFFWEKVRKHIKIAHGLDFKARNNSFILKNNPIRGHAKSKLEKLWEIIGLQSKYGLWQTNSKILFDSIIKISNSDVLIDSSKNIYRALALKKNLKAHYNIKFIHLIRDCRGLIHSAKKNSFSVQLPGEKEKLIIDKTAIPPEELIKMWKRSYLKTSFLLSTFVSKKNWKIIRFEEFCNNPQTIFKKLGEWLELEYNQDVVNYGNCIHHNVGGNSSRFNSRKILSATDTWRKTLSDDDISLFNRKAKFLNKLYGYKDI